VQQEHVPGGPLDESADRGATVAADEQITLPVTGDRSVIFIRRPLADHDHVSELARVLPAPPRTPPDPSSPQTSSQLAAQLEHDVVVHGGQYGLPQWTWGNYVTCEYATPDGLLMGVSDVASEPTRPVVYFVPWANIREGANLPVWSWEPTPTGPTPVEGLYEFCDRVF